MENDKFIEELKQVETSIMKYALKLTCNKDHARDLYQETILKAYVKRDTYSQGTNFKFWLFTILRNSFINRVNAEARYSSDIDISDMLSQNLEHSYRDCNIGVEEIRLIMKQLPSIYYTPLDMYISGYRYCEISRELHLPLSTIKNRIHIAREKLRVMLKDYME